MSNKLEVSFRNVEIFAKAINLSVKLWEGDDFGYEVAVLLASAVTLHGKNQNLIKKEAINCMRGFGASHPDTALKRIRAAIEYGFLREEADLVDKRKKNLFPTQKLLELAKELEKKLLAAS